ncbi:hypothetical protein F5888DRAFT_1640400 [Russula emetica]|nr:hypothetical protein F5888DRAFT_1640400 [Russula emetica]
MEGGTNYTWTALSRGWPGPSLSVPSLCTWYIQVKAEARYLIYCDAPSLYRLTWMFGHIPLVHSSSQFGPIKGIDEGSGGSYAENLLPQSSMPGHEGVPHPWIVDSAYAKVGEVGANHNSGRHSVSTSASLDTSHLYTHADTEPNFSVSSILGIPSAFTVGQYEEATSRNQPIQSPQMTKKRATASSRWSGRPAGAREALEQLFPCAICGEEYTQMQGVRRHIRTKHHPSSCLFCSFKYGRPEHYRNHLTKGHELEVAVVDEILGKPAGSRRRTKIIGRDLLQNVSPPVIKHDRPTRSLKPRQRRLMPPLSSVAKVTHIPSAFSSTEALARPVNDVVDYAPMLSPTRPGGSTYRPLFQPSDGTYPHTHPA